MGQGSEPSGLTRSFPSWPLRRIEAAASESPYTCEPSHQWVSTLTRVCGPVDPGGRVGSSIVRRMVIGLSGQVSSSSRSITQGFSLGLEPWLNQSWIMNWSQAAISEFPPGTSDSSLRVISFRLTSRAVGFPSTSSFSAGAILSSGMLRPNRVPAMPIPGSSRLFQLPSACRWVRCVGSGGGGCGSLTEGSERVSTRLRWRSLVRTPTSTPRASGVGSLSQPTLWSIFSLMATIELPERSGPVRAHECGAFRFLGSRLSLRTSPSRWRAEAMIMSLAFSLTM